MVRRSAITESEVIVKRSERRAKSGPRRAFLSFLALGLAAVLAVGYFWYFGFGKQASDVTAEHLKTRGLKSFEAQNYERASDYLVRYLKISPSDWKTREKLADAYRQVGNEVRAFSELEIVNRSAPRPKADRLYKLGLLAGDLGKKKQAVEYLGKAVKLGPKSLLSRVELAKALAGNREYDAAVSQLEIAIRGLPDKDLYAAVLYAEIGDLHAAEGDKEKAKEAYRRGLEIEPENVYLQTQLSESGG